MNQNILKLFLCSIIIYLVPLVGLSENYSVSKIQIDGEEVVSEEAIELQLKSQIGSVSSETVSQDVKALYRMGFFRSVNASFDQETLIFNIVEKPVVRKVYITGNKKLSEDDLSDAIDLGERRFLDPGKIRAIKRNAQTVYQTRGYYDASFEHSILQLDDNQVDVTLSVSEGDRFKVREIKFHGLSEVDSDELEDVMQNQRYRWWSSWLYGTGRVNQDQLENDRNLIRQYFLDHGLIDATVSEALVEKIEDGDLRISFTVNEGELYTVGEVGATGDLLDSGEEETIEGLELETGDIFNASMLRQDSFTVSDKFGDVGYAFANVVPNTFVNREENRVDVSYEVDKGKLVSINRIRVRGNEKTQDRIVRRELTIQEQDTFSSSAVRRSQALLQRLGYFEEATINTEPTDSDDEVDLVVDVREGSTGSFSAGAGFSSTDGAIFNTRISEQNIFGTGKRVLLNLDLGERTENAILSYSDRRFNDTYLSVGAELLRTERVFTDFDRNLRGGSITAGYPLEFLFGEAAEDTRFSIEYGYLNIDIQDVDTDAAQLVQDQEGETTSSSITPRLIRNTIDNPLSPTSGSRQTVSVELAGIGGNQEFYLVDIRNQWYYPLLETDIGEFVFSWRGRFGYGETFNDESFPLFRRFFPGGINSVRGFRLRTLGPRDDEGNEFGGSKQLVSNFELIFPIIQSAGLRGVVFYDIGDAFDDDESLDFGELRQAVGYGIRWTSPLGPIRVEFGFPIDQETGEDSSVTLFSFGAPI